MLAFGLALALSQDVLFPHPRIDVASSGFADFDGDGVHDVYSSRSIGMLADPLTVASVQPHPVVGYEAQAADFDGDGDLDVVVAADEIVLRLNDGAGAFAAVSWDEDTQVRFLAHGDLDGDGDLDLIGARGSGSPYVRVLLGDGVDAAQAVLDPALGIVPRTLDLGDLDLDGDLDLFAANSSSVGGYAVAAGLGDGTFAAPVHVEGPELYATVLVDLDRDGRLDVGALGVGALRAAFGDGAGGFGPIVLAASSPVLLGVARVRAADLDGDGALDLIGGTGPGAGKHLLVARGDGAGGFPASHTIALHSQALDFDVVDFDSDLDLDLAFGLSIVAEGPTYYVEQDAGVFVEPEVLVPTIANFDVGDLDGDGDPDLAQVNGAAVVGWNDGTGAYAFQPGPALSFLAQEVYVEDLEGDGSNDLIVGRSAGFPIGLGIHRTDGLGGFLPEVVDPLPGAASYGLAFADWTGDARLDVLAPPSPAPGVDDEKVRLYPSLATLGFGAPIEVTLAGADTLVLQVGNGRPIDLDQDGDLDVVVHVGGGASGTELRTLVNDGAGGLVEAQALPNGSLGFNLAVGDFDVDGRDDVLASNGRFYRGTGAGTLVFAWEQPTASTHAEHDLWTADLNADGADDALSDAGHVAFGGHGGPLVRHGYFQSTRALAADVDGDHRLDVIARNLTGTYLLRARQDSIVLFEAFGSGCAGSTGAAPTLLGDGVPSPGAAVRLLASGGLPSVPAVASFGLGAGATALPGGCTLLLDPWLKVFVGFPLGADGSGSIAFPVAPTAPPGTTLTTQVATFDPGAPSSFTLSNGLSITFP